MSINLSATTPAAPGGYVLAMPQADGLGNISVAVPTAGFGFKYTVISKTSNYVASSGDDVWCTGTFTVTLPAASTTTRVKVTNRGSGGITVSPASGTINGNATMILGTQYGAVELASDGTNWGIE